MSSLLAAPASSSPPANKRACTYLFVPYSPSPSSTPPTSPRPSSTNNDDPAQGSATPPPHLAQHILEAAAGPISSFLHSKDINALRQTAKSLSMYGDLRGSIKIAKGTRGKKYERSTLSCLLSKQRCLTHMEIESPNFVTYSFIIPTALQAVHQSPSSTKVLSLTLKGYLDQAKTIRGMKMAMMKGALAHLQRLTIWDNETNDISMGKVFELLPYCPRLRFLSIRGASPLVRCINSARYVRRSNHMAVGGLVSAMEKEGFPCLEVLEVKGSWICPGVTWNGCERDCGATFLDSAEKTGITQGIKSLLLRRVCRGNFPLDHLTRCMEKGNFTSLEVLLIQDGYDHHQTEALHSLLTLLTKRADVCPKLHHLHLDTPKADPLQLRTVLAKLLISPFGERLESLSLWNQAADNTVEHNYDALVKALMSGGVLVSLPSLKHLTISVHRCQQLRQLDWLSHALSRGALPALDYLHIYSKQESGGYMDSIKRALSTRTTRVRLLWTKGESLWGEALGLPCGGSVATLLS